jgi:reductive dehalogenase
MMGKPALEIESGDPPRLTAEVKKSALAYGAHSVGITKVNSRWVYSHDREGKRLREPLEYDYVIVMTVAVPSEPIGSSPAFPAARASAVSYSKMAFIIACIAEFIRRLGYRAWPMGNDTALSIPLAVAAGLGKLGRNGLLLTPDRGPCVKICKVFTDMELVEDEPINPPLSENCRSCFQCSEACEADAISISAEPSKEVVSPSNNQGIERWAVDHDRCYQFWLENGSDCSSCIAACPYTPSN